MQKMGDSIYDRMESEPEIIQAEIVDMAQVGPGVWREVRPVRRQRKRLLPALLFVVTCLSTLWAGVGIGGVNLSDGWWAGITHGLRYAIPVMTILICHEMGHFIQAWRYGVHSSFPFFIPMPFSPIGTFGAVIAMEPRIGGRRALFDIGISGPLAGLVPTFIFLIVGLNSSHYGIPSRDEFIFGYPPLLQYLATLIHGPIPFNQEIILSPMAFAGWVGLLVTSLNLIPIGQLDGGHILYALLRRRARKVAVLLLMTALFVVIWNWDKLGHWLLMIFLLFYFGPIHPPTADDNEPLGRWREILGWLTLAFILVGFTPVPLRSIPY